MKGRVVVFTGPRAPFEIEEFDVPDPEPGAVVLKVTQAGVCGSDLHTWRGEMSGPGAAAGPSKRTQGHEGAGGIFRLGAGGRPPPPRKRPEGHEGAGVVVRRGAGVTTDYMGRPAKEGDRIVYSAVTGCGRCHPCLNGHPNRCTMGFGVPGRFGGVPYLD